MDSKAVQSRSDVIRPTPIFVLGLQRSGTTWTANLLCQHPDCAGIQAHDHKGIHESIFFSHFARAYGDLTDDANYRRFLCDFEASDYYQLSGLPAGWIRSRNLRSYPAIFRALMDAVATREDCSFWVEKSPHHTLLCDQLAACFPDAKFICVRRQATEQIRSRLHNNDWTPTRYPKRILKLWRSCASYILYDLILVNFADRNKNAILVSYEQMLEELPHQLARITKHVGLQFDPLMLEVPYRQNSSFRRGLGSKKLQSACDHVLTKLFCSIFSWVPLAMLISANGRKLRRRGEPWPDWVWLRRPLVHSPPRVCVSRRVDIATPLPGRT